MLRVSGLTKSYSGITVLTGFTQTFSGGQIHGVIGENGAGKTTLMKIIAGVTPADSGSMELNGDPYRPASVRDAAQAGVVMVHQELNLIETLDVAENIFLGREPRRIGLIDRAQLEQMAHELLRRIQASIDPRAKVETLSIAQRQLVEIAKALSTNAKVLILDEPTAVLSEVEVRALVQIVRDLREAGVCVILISHILPQIVELCDTITVLRDGHLVAQPRPADCSESILADLMVGRELGDVFPDPIPIRNAGSPLLSVRGVSAVGHAGPTFFDLHAGEIVGVSGLVGAGRTELGEAIAGLRSRSGQVLVGGRVVPPGRIDPEIGYVTEDRKGKGLHLEMSIMENMTLANLHSYGWPLLKDSRRKQTAEHWRKELDISAPALEREVRALSGGNQQKVSVAKWLEIRPRVLILDEPTRGVDIGAKREIYALIHRLAADGMGCLVISSEMPELIGLCQRVLIIREGRIVGELAGKAVTEPALMRLAAGVATT